MAKHRMVPSFEQLNRSPHQQSLRLETLRVFTRLTARMAEPVAAVDRSRPNQGRRTAAKKARGLSECLHRLALVQRGCFHFQTPNNEKSGPRLHQNNNMDISLQVSDLACLSLVNHEHVQQQIRQPNPILVQPIRPSFLYRLPPRTNSHSKGHPIPPTSALRESLLFRGHNPYPITYS